MGPFSTLQEKITGLRQLSVLFNCFHSITDHILLDHMTESENVLCRLKRQMISTLQDTLTLLGMVIWSSSSH